MTEDEFKAIDARLAGMIARVERIIAKQSRGRRMPILKFKPRSRPVPAIASKCQQLNYRHFDHEKPQGEDCIEQIFADFERQFDEMAQAHR